MQSSSLDFRLRLIASSLIPVFDKLPVVERRIAGSQFEARQSEQNQQVMRMCLQGTCIIREIVQICLLGNTRLQGTFHCVARQLVGTRPTPSVQKSFRVQYSIASKLLQLGPVQLDRPASKVFNLNNTGEFSLRSVVARH